MRFDLFPVVLNVLEAGQRRRSRSQEIHRRDQVVAVHWKVTLSLYQSVPATLTGVAAVAAETVGPDLSMLTVGRLVPVVAFPALSLIGPSVPI